MKYIIGQKLRCNKTLVFETGEVAFKAGEVYPITEVVSQQHIALHGELDTHHYVNYNEIDNEWLRSFSIFKKIHVINDF